MSLQESVQDALNAKPIEPRDKAVADLALTYATQVDEGGPLEKLGPPLLAALEALGMSPRARAAATRGGKPDDAERKSPLDELRERRARKNGAPALDATAT